MTLASFVPDDQDAKLALINDTNLLLGPTLNAPTTQAPASDDDILVSLKKVSEKLHSLAEQHPSAAKLAQALDDVIAPSRPRSSGSPE